MRKMKLRIEDLAVDSFEVVAAALRRAGTVHGRAEGADAAAAVTTVQGEETCLIGVCTCWHSCQTCVDPSCPTNCASACHPCEAEVIGPVDAGRAG